jgi:hypothetical protein
MGLAECITSETVATARDLLSDYGYGLLKSPYIWIDEGLPDSITRKPADAFRDLVGGNKQFINRKHMPIVEMACPRRLLITANNPSVIMELCNKRDMTEEDREAVSLRLVHVDIRNRDDGVRWLDKHGGLEFTGKNGARWIGGSAGQPSNYIVAKHFLWLYANRGKAPGKRLLVEGDPKALIIEEMRMESGLGGLVCHILVDMLNAIERKRNIPGCTIEAGPEGAPCIKVTSAQVFSYWAENLVQVTKESVNIHRLGSALTGIATRKTNPIVLDSRPALAATRWYEIDPSELLRMAQRFGYSCKLLETLSKG